MKNSSSGKNGHNERRAVIGNFLAHHRPTRILIPSVEQRFDPLRIFCRVPSPGFAVFDPFKRQPTVPGGLRQCRRSRLETHAEATDKMRGFLCPDPLTLEAAVSISRCG